MSQPVALYRKYRSKSFDELVGQQHITQTLKNALKNNATSHAYLFTGPHGVGKTSTARILAHAINDIDYKDEGTTYLDIIEIDAASNRRIEEIRNLRETIHVAPSELKYKVYIIDEVHMLTKEAFNALLKTLEEPPAHAVFILATTEAHKLPATIVSRTQRHSFRPIGVQDAQNHLRMVAEKESITIDDESIELLAHYGKGSFRDTLSLLDQAAHSMNKNISKDSLLDMLGLVPNEAVESLSNHIAQHELAAVFGLLENLYEQGVTAQQIAQQLTATWRSKLKVNSQWPPIEAIEQVLEVTAHRHPEIALELALAKITLTTSTDGKPKSQKTPQAPDKAVENSKHATKPVEKNQAPHSTNSKLAKHTTISALKLNNLDIDDKWPTIIEIARNKSHSLFSSLRQAQPQLQDNFLKVVFRFPLHQKKVQQPSIKADFESVLYDVLGGVPDYECIVDSNYSAKSETYSNELTNTSPNNHKLKKITDIVGGDIIQLGGV